MHPFLKLEENETRIGAFLSEIAAPNLMRVYKASGLDYVIIDCEHGYFDHSQVAALCAVLRCSLPAWREPAAIAVEQRDVRPVPGRPGVLRASATIRNDGGWAQAWPQLVLTLSDVDGRALGMRRFEPAEYLTAPPQDVTIARGESAALLMDIVEPSPHAVAFNFSFE